MRAYGFDKHNLDLIVEAEAAVIREIANRVALGEPLMAIARNLNDRGVPTAYGNEWSGGTIRHLMRNKRISGMPVGNRQGTNPPIISTELHRRVLAALDNPARRVRLTKAHRNYLMSGWLRCARCDKVMPPKGGEPASYACSTRAPYKGCGRMRISAAAVDQAVVAKVLARIANAQVRASIAQAASLVHGSPDRIDELTEQIKAQTADPGQLARLQLELDAAVAEYHPIQRWGEWFAIAGNITPEKLAQWWIDADDRRRQDLLICILDHVDVLPVGRIGSYAGPDSVRDRLEFVWLV